MEESTSEEGSSSSSLPSTSGGEGAMSDVRSTAVVKYSMVKTPVQFSTIRLNTDLNFSPMDWTTKGSGMFHDQAMNDGSSTFSPYTSINMANDYQDLVGKVDVISSSKNIKELLKMPYSQSPRISLMVHRLGPTLLLEQFDVHKHLIRKETEEWQWLSSYFKNIIAKEEEESMKCLLSPSTQRDNFTEKMYLNLIRHHCFVGQNQCTALQSVQDRSKNVPTVPHSSEELKWFHHDTLWTFEDISMLIDSDLPIFGGDSHRPCISLRLRDARSPPINVLTGIDYWLDNLMSNVPEVAMCYHIDGLVQKYEVMKTEDIPHLKGSSFNPNEVMDIARNIMAFIKSNAAVEGHTYWLYKGEKDEMVKLYDLTDHCKSEMIEGDNPFIVPVGMLCYRVGRNIKTTGQRRSADSRAMLESCLRLLDDAKHSQVCTDAHFHLSDMWVPDRSVNDIWQSGGKISDPPSDLYDEDESNSDERQPSSYNNDQDSKSALKALEDNSLEQEKTSLEQTKQVALQELVVKGMVKKRAWNIVKACRIAGETDERCRMALGHIRKALNCLDKDRMKAKNIGLVEKQQTCSPSKAIPMHYTPLNKGSSSESSNVASSSIDESEFMLEPNPFVAIPLHYVPLNIKVESDESTQSPSEADSASQTTKTTENVSQKTETKNEAKEISCVEALSHFKLTSACEDNYEKSVVESWHTKAKFRLLRKAAITYFVLAKQFYEIAKYGHALRHLRYAMHCYESLEYLGPSVRDEPQDKEMWLMLTYLAAKARLSLSPSNWHTCHREFEELAEEEAAILHSAQAVLATPKNAWMYDWPTNQESNLLVAKDLFELAWKLPGLQKKANSFRMQLKRQEATCNLLLGNTQMEICKEKIMKNGDTFASVQLPWQRSCASFKRAHDLFEAVGEKNTAAHMYSNLAYMNVLAANAFNKHEECGQDPMSHHERRHLLQAAQCYVDGLKHYERGEHMDDAREIIYSSLRVQYHQMACRYFRMPSSQITEEHIDSMKDYLCKSIMYCHVDTPGKHLRQSQILAAVGHLNLARVFDVECSKIKNASKRLRHKVDEHYLKSFDLYNDLKWRRSQISVKDMLIKSILDNSETMTHSNIQSKKRVHRLVLGHCADLHAVVQAMIDKDCDDSDETEIFPNNLSAIQQLIRSLNAAFFAYLRIDKNATTFKNLYQQSLRLTTVSDLTEILPKLATLLQELQHAFAIDS